MTELTESRIRHTVAFTLRHDDDSSEAAGFLAALANLESIDGVEEFQVLSEVSPKNGYRYGVTMEFANQIAYETYNASPEHVEFVSERWDADVAEFLEIDFAAIGT